MRKLAFTLAAAAALFALMPVVGYQAMMVMTLGFAGVAMAIAWLWM